MKKTWKHINFEQRKTIASGVSHSMKVKEIGELLNLDPTGISREVKRNREIVEPIKNTKVVCPKLSRWPYVCSNCKKRYLDCPYNKFIYNAKHAQENAEYNLKVSRKGLDITHEEFIKIDKLIKQGVDNNKSIYQIKMENKDMIDKSITTLYRYINKGYLTTTRMDLPYAVSYKKRKHNKKYAYSENNKIDRTGHTYLDYLAFTKANPGINVWQLDFLGAIKTDNKSILSFILPDLQFSILDIINNPNSIKVVEFFDKLEERIGTNNFIKLIPVILNDRDPCFNDIEGICFSKINGEERCKIFSLKIPPYQFLF
ncbi:MAG: helix-turn-helix domain-containing protein [Bacilli bacterium]|nr:helix-turn-helix domain-containing protein [Bacilli bacterium]